MGLVTFTLGLASAWGYDAHTFGVWEVPVDLPEASNAVIAVEPVTRAEMGWGGSGSCGRQDDVESYFRRRGNH